MHIKLIALNARYIHSCLALFYLRREIEEHLACPQPELLQFTINDPYYSTLLRISEGDPDGLFFSVYIWNSNYVRRLIGDLQQVLPKAVIVLGGPQAPYVFDELGAGDPTIQQNCTVVHGEVEGLPFSFFEDLRSNRLRPEYVCTVGKTFVSPYQRTDFTAHLENRHIYYESSRGCPFTCSYCLSSLQKGVRHKGLEQVREELLMILEQKPKMIRFVDRTFNDRPDRALAIWQFLAEHARDSLCHFEIVPDRITDEMFSFLETIAPGRFQFEIGIQSTNPATLKSIRRQMDLEKMRSNITRLTALDTIHIHVDLILGLPYENLDVVARSFNDVFSLSPHYIQMGLLKILPETPLCTMLDEFGIHACKSPPYEILNNHWLSHTLLAELYWFGNCLEAFYNNRFFRTIWSYIRRAGEDGFYLFRSLLENCKQDDFFYQAPTQEYMSSMLMELANQRTDRDILLELLLFDWLKSGQRSAPAHLQIKPLQEVKNELRERLPQSVEGLYDSHSRNSFFRHAVFAFFSGKAVLETGMGKEMLDGYVCFRPQEQPQAFPCCRTDFIPVDLLRD